MKNRKSIRKPKHDYSEPGWYFVTISTKDKEAFFGKIVDGKVQLSAIGKQAEQFWKNIAIYNKHVELGEFVIMPDHIHGIIGIVGDCKDVAVQRPNDTSKNQYMSSIAPKPGSLSVVIRSYKSALTKWCRQNGYFLFDWLPRFHDRIIRDQPEFDRIEEYIRMNPKRWGKPKQ
ncbi:transposase [Marinifilum fragile]|uniref:transposase n=1 Tax=Marinifilum fragile TaxID=570161 RepID=UPI0006D019E6|nr:transposase [Marinifilum fragile]